MGNPRQRRTVRLIAREGVLDTQTSRRFPHNGFKDVWIEVVLRRIRILEAGGEGRNRRN